MILEPCVLVDYSNESIRFGQSPEMRERLRIYPARHSQHLLLTPHQRSPNPSGEGFGVGENWVEILIFALDCHVPHLRRPYRSTWLIPLVGVKRGLKRLLKSQF